MTSGNTLEQANKNFLQKSNFGIDLDNIKNLHDLFQLKIKTEGLSAEELKERERVEERRFMFEKNEYLKMNDIRSLIDEGMQALQKRMRTADEVIKKNNETLRVMESKVKNCISQVNSLQKLNKGQTILFRQFKEHEIRIVDNHHDAMDRLRQMKEKYEALTGENENRDKKTKDL